MRSGIFGLKKWICPQSSIEALESRIAPATIFVTTLDDSGSGSLRDAIDQANDADGPDVIKFKVKGDILLESTLPSISDSLTIKGKGSAHTIIDGADAFRILEIAGPSALDVTISGVTLQNGRAAESGGALEINNALGKVQISKSVIQDSVAIGAQGEDAVGGGIANHNALLTIVKSRVSGNQAIAGEGEAGAVGADGSAGIIGTSGDGGGDGSVARGGGIFNGYYAALTLVKSTISGNTAFGGDGGAGGNGGSAGTGGGSVAGDGGNGGRGGAAFGGGIDNRGSLSIQKSEISGNTATGGFGGNGGATGGGGDPAYGLAYAGYGGDGGDAVGGGVSSDGGLEVSRSGFYDNEALGNYGGYSGDGRETYDGYAGYGRGGGVGVSNGHALIVRVTISGNYAEYGGGLFTDGDEAIVENSLILTNDALEGGGMYVEGRATVLFNSVVEDNAATDGGGGIAAHGELDIVRSQIVSNFADTLDEVPNAVGGGILVTGNVRIDESQISFNEANGDGGGIFVDEGSLELTGSIVTWNNATVHGGGIVASEEAYVSIYDSGVTDNTATVDGGGVRLHDYATVVVDRSTISFNTADRDGGGVSVEDSAFLILRDTTVSGNTAGRDGGGISNTGQDYYYDYYGGTIQAAETRIERSTISGNDASEGGGIFHTGGYLDLLASTIAENTATGNGGGISLSAAISVLASTIARNSADGDGGGLWIDEAAVEPSEHWISSSIIADNAAIDGQDLLGRIEASYTLVGSLDGAEVIGSHNIVNEDPLLGPLKKNGGYTLTMAPKGNSPVIDAGTGLGEVFDQRGNYRLLGAGVDIGAVEAR